MANALAFSLVLLSILSGVQSCDVPKILYAQVPQTILSGQYVTTVEVENCDSNSIHFTVNDTIGFKIFNNGTIKAAAPVEVPVTGRTFYVYVEDNTSPKRPVQVWLNRHTMQKEKKSNPELLYRFKRRWSPPPFNILENDKGPFPREIEKIVSDSASTQEVYYTFSGPGVDRPPLGIFELKRDTGMLVVHKAVDREQYDRFVITTNVYNAQTGLIADDPLDIVIIVDDENDNAPTFTDPLQFTVPEKSAINTIVGKVNSTDRDQQGTLHVRVKYSLLDGLGLFSIHPVTGIITTTSTNLDREVKDTYFVTVQIKDLAGAANGLSNTGTATIKLTDVNDNPPTFSKSSYPATIEENASEKVILRMPVEDKDLLDTPNWISKFVISKGDDDGHFRVDRDPKTNDGLLYVVKPLDFEKSPTVNLQITAQNEADLRGTTAQWNTVPVTVEVTNIDEGPEFSAPNIRLPVKENTPNGTLIGMYKALDPETKSSDGIKYYKVDEPASWVNINRDNGEVRVANTIDRESPFVKDGLYSFPVKAIDASSKTGTGTIILVVEDENDNKPTFPPGEMLLCEKEGELGSVLVVAEDNDQRPFSSPFTFSMPADNDGKWSVTNYNDTAATLKHLKELPTGIYDVPVVIKDLQGNGEKQIAKVRICQCRNGQCLPKKSGISLGPLGILALLLPLLLLLLLALLLVFFCTTKREYGDIQFDDVSKGHLISSNTEAPGEEVDSAKLTFPSVVQEAATKGSVNNLQSEWKGVKSTSTIGNMSTHDMGGYQTLTVADGSGLGAQYQQQYSGVHGMSTGQSYDYRYFTQDASFLHTWQTNGRYLQQKLPYLGTEDDGRFAEDIIHAYGYEGAGSVAGSVGCCSELGDNDNLDFLNTLGPKFKSLAEVSRKT